MARTPGKTSIWLSAETAALIDQYEVGHPGEKVNLSELVAEAVRRYTGQLNREELVAERASSAAVGVEKLQKEIRALARRVAALEKGAK